MCRFPPHVWTTCGLAKFTSNLYVAPFIVQQTRAYATTNSQILSPYGVRCLEAPRFSHAHDVDHVRLVSEQLEKTGILKVRLGFPDNDSKYLKELLLSLHKYHQHHLPISHSATRGWFWDVRPSETTFQAGSHQARSETMNQFPWHTDCSYEDPPPRYFALQVLQHDRYGGGTLSVMDVKRLSQFLSPATRAALEEPEYRISIPSEFMKDPNRTHLVASVFATSLDNQSVMIRYREDILAPLTDRASRALKELSEALVEGEVQDNATIHFRSADLPKGSIILIDNRRWLHARNHINDPNRHLRRVRWHACSFDSKSNMNYLE